jgi:hypothetical protein
MFLAVRYNINTIATTWLLSNIFSYLKMGFDSSKKGRKASPKKNASNTTNIEAGSEWDFVRLRPVDLASFETQYLVFPISVQH